MLGEAIEYPARGRDWLKRIGIGGILVLVGAFLLLPLLLVEGYVYRVLARTAAGDRDPPPWDDWVELFVDGIKLTVVQIVYLLIPGILVGVGVLITFVEVLTGEGVAMVGSVVMLLGGVLSLFVMYVLPAALTNVAYQDSLGAAFAFPRIAKTAFSWGYFVPILTAGVVGLVASLIGVVLSLVLVGMFIIFYVYVVVAYLWGVGFAKGGGTLPA